MDGKAEKWPFLNTLSGHVFIAFNCVCVCVCVTFLHCAVARHQWSERQISGIVYSPVHRRIHSHTLLRPSRTCLTHTCTGEAILCSKKEGTFDTRKLLRREKRPKLLILLAALNFSRKSSSSICFPVKYGAAMRGRGLISQRLTQTLLRQQGGWSMKGSKAAASDHHILTFTNYILTGRGWDCVWAIRFM